MKKTFLIGLGLLGGAYLLIHLALGSSPVQRWVLDQVRKTLVKYGFELEIESIEFSAFTPKLYLNRVKLSTRPRAIIQLNDPLAVDKIKLQFQPLALISKRIVIDEIVFFHPQVNLPRADKLYKRITGLIKENQSIELKGKDTVAVLVRRVGVVDALFDVKSMDPPFAVRSRGFSAFLERSAGNQQAISVQSRDLELERQSLKVALRNVDIDVDMTPTSLRVNRALVHGENLSVNVKGTSSLPFVAGKGPDSSRVSYDVSVPLQLLTLVPELKIDKLSGQFQSGGSLMLNRGTVSGSGDFTYSSLNYDGYKIGGGKAQFQIAESKVVLSKVDLSYAGGNIRSQALKVGLNGRMPISGELELKGFLIEGLLDGLRNPNAGVHTSLTGTLKAEGFLSGPLDIQGDLDTVYEGLVVLNHGEKPVTAENTLMDFGGGTLRGKIGFLEDRFTYKTSLTGLSGQGEAEGFVGYHNTAKVKARLDAVSFSQLKRISSVGVGGKLGLSAEVEVKGSDVKAVGAFDFTSAEIAGVVLGNAKGTVYYQNLLLSFESVEIPALEPIRGNGYLDFSKDEMHYKFDVDIARAGVNQIFEIFQKTKLGFSPPKGGESSARISIEGGHDKRGIEVVASGRSKNFSWYGENWSSSKFIFTYRPDAIELNRVTLFKKSGALDTQGLFANGKSRLSLRSEGLRIEELDLIKGAPLAGEVQGEMTLEGTPEDLYAGGEGEVKWLQAAFRGQPLPDTSIRVRRDSRGVEFLGNILGETMRGRYVRAKSGPAGDELLLYFQRFDFLPLISLLMGKDITTLTSVLASGDLSLKGNLQDWRTLKGTGSVNALEIGLRGTPLKNREPLFMKVEGGQLDLGKFYLTGVDGEIAGEAKFQSDKIVDVNLDGKLDLQYLQPFIPVLDYGLGKTVLSLRISGKPDKFKMLGSLGLEDGTLRFTGLRDEFRNAQVQLSLSQDQVDVDKFEASVNGGRLRGSGSVSINRFSAFKPRLLLAADRVELRLRDYLAVKLSGDFVIQGAAAPYALTGECTILEGKLTRFDTDAISAPTSASPAFSFDVNCDAADKLFVQTDIMDAEFKGKFHVVGTTDQVGLLGRAEGIRGSVLFRETRFNMESANVRFNSANEIQPRFRVAARAVVKEQKTITPQEYDINLQTFGTPENYKIVLSSSPALTENDIISLLLLGVTSRDEANYVGLGATIAGQVPLQSKVGSELGVDIKIKTQTMKGDVNTNTTGTAGAGGDITVPSVQIQKEITKKTKVSYSNSLDPVIPIRELRIEQILDENLSVNATTVNRPRGATETPTQSYGLDFRYRFQFD